MISLSIIIVNWNAGAYLVNCVNSILQSSRQNFNLDKIIVVDNGSTDNSLDCLPSLAVLSVIKNNKNLGFGKACNIGAKEVKSDLILMLNPDTVLNPYTLDKSIEFYVQQSSVLNFGILGIQLLDINGKIQKSCSRFACLSTFFFDCTGLSKIFKRCGEHMFDFDHKTSRVIDHVIGAYYLLSLDIFRQLHGFDEDYFIYLEDLDFSYRARQVNIQSYYYVGTNAIHAGGGCSDQVKAKRLFYSINSRLVYARKHFTLIKHKMAWGISLLIEPISRIGFSLVRFNLVNFKETVSAYWMLYKKLIQVGA